MQARPVRSWLSLWSLAGCFFLSGVLLKCYWPANGLYDVTGYVVGRDYINIWAASHLLLNGQIGDAYDLHAFIAMIRDQFGEKFPFHNWSYPPTILPFIAPFGLFSYSAGLLLWTVSGLAAYLYAARPRHADPFERIPALLLLSAPATIVNLLSGQNGFFTAACFLGGFALLDRRPVWAGILFGLLTVKPHLGILIPLALIILRQWRAFTAATITTLTMVAVSLAIGGSALWSAYQHGIIPYQHELLVLFKGFYAAMMPGTFAAARVVGLSMATANWLNLLSGIVAAILALGIVKREGNSPRAVLALALASMLAIPYGYNYDLTIISGALLIALIAHPPASMSERLLYGAVWVLPAAIYAIMFAHLPLAPIILFTALAHLHRKSTAVA